MKVILAGSLYAQNPNQSETINSKNSAVSALQSEVILSLEANVSSQSTEIRSLRFETYQFGQELSYAALIGDTGAIKHRRREGSWSLNIGLGRPPNIAVVVTLAACLPQRT